MIDKPTPISAIIVCFSLIISLVIVPHRVLPLPSIIILVVGLFNIDLRQNSKPYLRIIIISSLLLSLITISSIIGGASLHIAVIPSIRSLGLICTMTVSILFLYVSIDSMVWLFIFNKMKIPKTLIFILLSSITSLILVKNYGATTISLLKLKGYSFKSVRSRFGAYIRIVSPLFSVLLSTVQIQARSLHYRGFFTSREEIQLEPQWHKIQLSWLLVAFLSIGVWILIKKVI